MKLNSVGTTTSLWFGTLLLTMSPNASAMQQGEWSLDINGASWHSERRYQDNGVSRKYNQTNPGLGASIAWRNDIDIKFGFFDNSYKERSYYLGAHWHKDFYFGNWTVAPGASLLLTTGYDDTPEDAPTLAPIPVLGVAFGHKAVKLNLGFVPFGDVELATLQLQFVPKYW